jgi:hypothetical protein
MVDLVCRVMSQNPYLPFMLAQKNKSKIQHSKHIDSLDLKVGGLISGDIIRKIQPTINGDVYFYLFVEKEMGYMRAYITKTKDGL